MKTKLLLTVLLSFCLVPWASAQIPQTMSYQGVLTDASGNPVADGPVSLTFKLYDVAENGEPLWEETQDVQVTDGIFNVILGSQTPLTLPFDAPYWLGITVGEENELTPRTALTAAPYSLNAASTLVEPEPGQGLVIRDDSGEATHQFSPEGDVTHTGTGTFIGGIVIGDTVIVPEDTTGASLLTTNFKSANREANNEELPEIGLSAEGRFRGVVGASDEGTGVLGVSTSGRGVFGFSRSKDKPAVDAMNFIGPAVVARSSSERPVITARNNRVGGGPALVGSVPTGGLAVHAQGRVKVDEVPEAPDQERFLVWDADSLVKYRTLPSSGESFNGTLVGNPFHLINTNGDTVFSVETDGTSLHKGLERFLDGIELTDENEGRGTLIGQNEILIFDENGNFAVTIGSFGADIFKPTTLRDTLFVKDATGNIVTMFAPDGTSLHTGEETFEDDVILKGERGKGIKLVADNGETIAGFGRIDLETGQRLGVFAKAEQTGDLAGAFEGDVEVVGELFASSMHVVNDEGDTLTSFNADGTSLHTGEEVFEGGIRVQGDQGTEQGIDITLPNTASESPAFHVDYAGLAEAVKIYGSNPEFLEDFVMVAPKPGVANFNMMGNGINVNVGGTNMVGLQSVASGNAGAFINNSPDLTSMFAFNFDATGLGFSTNANAQIDGDLEVGGDVMKGGGGFKIDHPLDPANKYLNHSFVESPQRMNVYNGNVVLDGNGEAVVELPDWFEALNEDFRYQLTCVGGFAQVYIAEEIRGNRFKIAGGTAGLKVSWQVSGVRKDAYARANPLPVEEQKGPGDIGRYRHPEAFGQPREAGIYYARPEVRKMMAEKQNSIPAMK